MKITIEAEPKELAALVLNLQKQLDVEVIVETWNVAMEKFVKKLDIKNPEIQVL